MALPHRRRARRRRDDAQRSAELPRIGAVLAGLRGVAVADLDAATTANALRRVAETAALAEAAA